MSRGRYGKCGESKRLRRLRRAECSRSRTAVPPDGRTAHRFRASAAQRIRVREAGPADRLFITRLSGRAFRRFGSYAGIIREWLDSGEALTLVALSGGRAVGFAMAARIPPPLTAPGETEILAIAVAPEARRSGIGRLLLRGVETAVRVAGAGMIRLHTAMDNLPARALFEREGFRILGLERRFYPHGQDALLMIKETPAGET